MSQTVIKKKPAAESPTLKRSLSLSLITFYGLGTIIGAGVYVLIGEVAGRAGMYAPFSFALAAVIAAFTAFSCAELSARHPKSVGEAVYVQEAFRQRALSALTGWAVVLIGIVSAATISNGFVGYLRLFVDVPDWFAISALVIALGLLVVFALVNLALWRLKIHGPHPAGIVRYPLWVPVIGFVLCIGFLVLWTVH